MKKHPSTVLALIALAAVAGPARATEARGLELGLRAAYALPLGNAGDGARLRGLTTGALPMQLEAGWRFDERWLAGAYLTLGPTFSGGDGRSELRAQGARSVGGHYEQRIGLQVAYTVMPSSRCFVPWVGLAAGYEWTRYADAKLADGREIEVGLRGFDAALQAGGDMRVSPWLAVGPFASLHLGQYRSRITWVDHADETATRIADRGIHGWAELGVKGTFGF